MAAVATALATLTVALAGCSEEGLRGIEVVVVNGDVPPDINNQAYVRNEQCGEHGELLIRGNKEQWDSGFISVIVKGGDGFLAAGHQRVRGDDVPITEELVGVQGTWTLEVRRSVEMDSPFTVTFRC